MMDARINFTHTHLNWNRMYFDPTEYDLFVVPTRDPVERIISAFNWNHPIGGDPPRQWRLTEAGEAMYRCFPELPGGINRFAEALDEDSPCGFAARRCLHSTGADCGHLAKDFRWYLQTGLRRDSQDLLSALRAGGRHALEVSTHNFNASMATLMDWLCVPPEQRPPASADVHSPYDRSNDTYVSPRGMAALRNHTEPEDYALEELRELVD
jgi:hypothetical protein